MRSNTPQPPDAYQQTGSLPSASYLDPVPTNTANYDGYLSPMNSRGDATGIAGGLPLQAADPTAGSVSVGGWSYNLDSRNYAFVAPVLSQSGRAGLGVTLAMTYNSSPWIMHSSDVAIAFNPDRGFPAPGWRLGFGAIQAKTNTGGSYLNTFTGKQSFIYIAPDGTRHDLAYNSSTGYYESYDSTYIRFHLGSRVLQTPNGARIHFQVDSMNNSINQFLPNYIIDRNGNFINIYYQTLSNGAVVMQYLIDTAGRRVDFNYQNNRLVSISQNRNGVTFYFIRLDYQPITIQTNFSVPTDPVNINGTQVYFPVRITYPTGINYRFSYTSYGQIKSIRKWVPTIAGQDGSRMIASTSFNLPEYDPNNAQGDCPFFITRTEWAENWQGGATQSYQYSYLGSAGYGVTDPSGRRFHSQINGQTLSVSVFPPNESDWTKRDEITWIGDSGVPYNSNLRVSEASSNVIVSGGTQGKRATFSYIQRDGMWLVEQKDEFDSSSSARLRRTGFTYTSYPAQYILGLPQQISVHSGALTLLHRVTNNYDETGTFVDSNNQTASYFIDASGDGVIQQDNANYGVGFTARANVTSVTQSKVESGAVTGSRIIKRTSYDTNGNVRAVTDNAGNRSQLQFGDYCVNKPGGVGQTHLIPYTSADPTGFRKGSQWDYFTGLTVKSFNLTPGSSTETQIVTTSYDFADRPLQTTRPDGGWVKTAYWDNWRATVTSQLFDTGKTRYKFEEYDGAGRVRRKASDHPDGVSGKFSGQVFVFNNLGQTEDSSNVITINSSWVPSGDDASTGFLFTHLTRDELSRLKVVTFPDNNTRQYDYTGCGCAGNSETRITDEMGHYTITKTDGLGRLIEAIEPPPGQPSGVYSKAKYIYDAMDRLIRIDHTDVSLTKIQSRHFTYDGYGRLIQENTPEAGIVDYTYTANDLPLTKKDARNITTTFGYNTRNLTTSVSYSDSTPGVSFAYDEFGARQTMTDGEGSTSYVYNGFRQLQSETRTFTALTNKSFALSYTYNLADQPKSVNEVMNLSGGGQMAEEEKVLQAAATARPRSAQRNAQAANFHYISGMARQSGGQAIAGATITATRQDSAEPNFSVQTDAFGQYQINDVPAGATYRVTASKSGYTFAPTEIILEMTGDMQDINFTGTPPPTPSGTLAANPNPIQVCDGTGQGVTTLSWTASNVTAVQVRAGAPNGTLVASGGTSGNVTTGKWVTNGTVFYLQNVSNGLPLTSANTLATRTVGVITAGCTFNKRVNYAYNSVGALSGVGTDIIGSDPNATTNVLNTLTFRANGAISSLRYGNGRRLQMGYNPNRQQAISMKVDRVSNPSDKIIDYAYEYYDQNGNNNNRIRKVTDNIEPAYTTDYSYDDYNRLVSATASGYTRSYSYDAWGNITNTSGITYNYPTNGSGAPATNRMSSNSNGVNYSHDAAGNLTQVGAATNAYEGAGRLKTVNDDFTSTYGYDGNGGRVRVTDGAAAAVYYVRSSVLGQVAMEVTSTGVRRAYVYAGNKLVAQQSTDGQFYWLHTNHLGSARAMTDVNGNLVYRGQFDPYGKTLTEWSASGNMNLNTKKFTGYERDATGLDYANARMYNSGRGRFMQPDPIGLEAADLKRPQSLNRYSYTNGDPINFVDPSGLFGLPEPDRSAFCMWGEILSWPTEWLEWAGCYRNNEGARVGGNEGGRGDDRYNKLTKDEKTLCLLYPEVCSQVYLAMNRALQERQNRYGDPPPDNNDFCDNAFLHAYWNALMVHNISRLASDLYPGYTADEMAKAFADAHEARPNNPPFEQQMDFWNNNVGRIIDLLRQTKSP